MGSRQLRPFIILISLIIVVFSFYFTYTLLNKNDKKNPYTLEERAQIYEYIIKGDVSQYDKYLNDGAKLSFAFADGTTPLETLIYANDLLSAEKLINNGFNLKLVDNNHIDTISNILGYNKNFEISNIDDIALTLIKQIKNEIEKEDTFGYSLLMNAIYTNNVKVVKEIVENIKSVDKVYNKETALSYASELGNVDMEIILTLIAKGANINFKGNNGFTPLMYAIYNNNSDLIKKLINNNKININLQNEYGQTALHVAVDYYNIEAVELLLEYTKIDQSIKDNDNLTAKELARFLEFEDIYLKLK